MLDFDSRDGHRPSPAGPLRTLGTPISRHPAAAPLTLKVLPSLCEKVNGPLQFSHPSLRTMLTSIPKNSAGVGILGVRQPRADSRSVPRDAPNHHHQLTMVINSSLLNRTPTWA